MKSDRIARRRLTSSYFTTIVSISLVLFLMGLLGLLVLNAKKLSDYVKENISFSIILKEKTKEVDIMRLQKTLDASRFVKETKYISEDDAATEMQEELGEDFIKFLGYNPLLASIDVKLHAKYANQDSINIIVNEFQQHQEIKEIYYEKSLVHLINENIKRISIIIIIFSGLLSLIAFTLINNTIRLSVYSKRFLIHTMLLVGATRGFIRRPFLSKSILNGILGSLIGIALISGIIYFAQKELSQVISFADKEIVAILFGTIILLGIILNLISTLFATNKYLRIKTDNLYY